MILNFIFYRQTGSCTESAAGKEATMITDPHQPRNTLFHLLPSAWQHHTIKTQRHQTQELFGSLTQKIQMFYFFFLTDGKRRRFINHLTKFQCFKSNVCAETRGPGIFVNAGICAVKSTWQLLHDCSLSKLPAVPHAAGCLPTAQLPLMTNPAACRFERAAVRVTL